MEEMAGRRVTQEVLAKLAEQWEPEASNSPQTYRMARCAGCGNRLWFRMYHCWLKINGFKKEIHLCRRCWKIWSS